MCNKWVWLLIPVGVAQAADACRPQLLSGPYAFQLTGSTDISGKAQSASSMGRIVFESGGKISGTSSVMFSGLLLGNPVTGTYEAQQDCSVTWQLQDDSGAYQHFAGKMSADGARVAFKQTDRGGIAGGIMEKTGDSCTAANLRQEYTYNLSGKTKAQGTIDTTREGSFQVDSDCGVHFMLKVPGSEFFLTMRGFLVNGGKRILAFQTDPGSTANQSAVLSSKGE